MCGLLGEVSGPLSFVSWQGGFFHVHVPAPLTEQPVELTKSLIYNYAEVFSPLLLCHAYLQQQQHHQHHHATLISSHVIMESVSRITTGVMVTMTVVTTVMKLDVMV